jgi:hypothetical protein
MQDGHVGDDRYEAWARDSGVLAQIGRAVFSQSTRIAVRLPRALADDALAAWQRDNDGEPLPSETAGQRAVRHRAATLGLIGLSIETVGTWDEDEVVVELEAWYIGDACSAAEEAGLLVDAKPPTEQ